MGMIEVERRPDGVAVVVLDHPTKPVNTLSPAVVEEFNQKVAPLLDDASVRLNPFILMLRPATESFIKVE